MNTHEVIIQFDLEHYLSFYPFFIILNFVLIIYLL